MGNSVQKPKAVIFDLDGVISDSSERFGRIDMVAWRNKDTQAFAESIKNYNRDCVGDVPIPLGFSILNHYAKDHKIFFITARGSEGYWPTLNWLKEHCPWYESNGAVLIMQYEDTNNIKFSSQFEHADYKRLEAKKILEDYDVVFAIDDSIDNVRAYISLEIPTLHFILPNLGRVLV